MVIYYSFYAFLLNQCMITLRLGHDRAQIEVIKFQLGLVGFAMQRKKLLSEDEVSEIDEGVLYVEELLGLLLLPLLLQLLQILGCLTNGCLFEHILSLSLLLLPVVSIEYIDYVVLRVPEINQTLDLLVGPLLLRKLWNIFLCYYCFDVAH